MSPALPPMKRMVDEGLLIALSAVRMAVKNDIIIGALREHADYDPARYALSARNELSALARQNEGYARRARRLRKVLTRARWSADFTDDQRSDISQLALRRRVHQGLAIALDAVAVDDEQVAHLVERARQDAGDEISEAVTARLIRLAVNPHDPEYEQRRAARTEALVHINLALLVAAHDAANEY